VGKEPYELKNHFRDLALQGKGDFAIAYAVMELRDQVLQISSALCYLGDLSSAVEALAPKQEEKEEEEAA
jgi:hypothetical protein